MPREKGKGFPELENWVKQETEDIAETKRSNHWYDKQSLDTWNGFVRFFLVGGLMYFGARTLIWNDVDLSGEHFYDSVHNFIFGFADYMYYYGTLAGLGGLAFNARSRIKERSSRKKLQQAEKDLQTILEY